MERKYWDQMSTEPEKSEELQEEELEVSERVAFFRAHKAVIGPIIEKENAKRSRRGTKILSEDEIDAGIGQMMDISTKGKDISAYRFPVQVVEIKSPPKIVNDKRFQFDITQCENGYMMTKGESKFIFRSPKELMSIFNKMFFEKADGKE